MDLPGAVPDRGRGLGHTVPTCTSRPVDPNTNGVDGPVHFILHYSAFHPFMPAQAKQLLRQQARQIRADLRARQPDFAKTLATYAADLALLPGTLIGAYAPLPDEADPTELVRALAKTCPIAYPRVVSNAAPLVFHLWSGEALSPGTFGIPEPAAASPIVTPTVLLVPLLAFDARGHRLGYGGGFYDRTLASLSARTIGIAFAGQEIENLPDSAHDHPLGAVLTEKGLSPFPRL